jgi:putative tryptophan/tyrosine transport system substrate-binding protein
MTRCGALLLALLAISFSIGGEALPQTPERIYRLGVLSSSPGTLQRLRTVMFPELARLGFTEGRNFIVEARFGPMEELPTLARQLAAANPDAIIAAGNAIGAAQQATSTIAIIGSFIGEDPIAAGFAASLARPGGNVTGVVMLGRELDGKRLQLLHEAVPGGSRIAALGVSPDEHAPTLAAMRHVASHEGLALLPFYAAVPEDYPSTFAAMRGAGASALQILSAPQFFTNASTLAELALKARLPTMCEWRSMAAQGCLLGYGPDYTELQRRVADHVARILRGAAPGDLPIEQPTHFEFAVNMKTAAALGLTVPPSILARADEVIE